MLQTCDVSFIIYHYKNVPEEGLLETIRSYIGQRMMDSDYAFEVVLLLDGISLKDLTTIHNEIKKNNILFQIVEEGCDFLGPGKLWNKGFEISKGKKVVFTWTGINWLSDSLYCLETLLKNTKADAIYGGALYEYITKEQIKKFSLLGEKDLSIDFLSFSNSMLLGYTLINREVVKELGGFCEDKEHTQIVDWEFILRLIFGFKVEALVGKRLMIKRKLSDISYNYRFKYTLDEEIRYFINKTYNDFNPLKEPTSKHTRLNQITMGDKKDFKIALVTGVLEDAQVQLKVVNYLELVQEEKKITWRRFIEIETSPKQLQLYDWVIFIRSRSPYAFKLAQYCAQNNIKILYLLDDNWFCITETYPELEQEMGENTPSYKAFIRLITTANYVLTYNDIILEEVKKYNENVFKMPISINLGNFKPEPKMEQNIWIGFAGSGSKEKHFEPAFKALRKIMDEFSEVRLYIQGVEVPKILEAFKERIVHRRYKYDYKMYVKEVCEYAYDIMISPMDETCYTNSKCAYKYLEYTALGAAGIYASTKVTRKVIKNEENGLIIPNDEEEWYKALKKLIIEPELREKIVVNAKKDVMTKFDAKEVKELFVKMLENI